MQHRTLSLGQATRFEAQRVAMCLPCSGKMICLIFLNSGFMLVGLRFLGPILADCTGVRAHVSTETLHMKPVLPPALAKNIWNGESFLGCSRGDCYQRDQAAFTLNGPRTLLKQNNAAQIMSGVMSTAPQRRLALTNWAQGVAMVQRQSSYGKFTTHHHALNLLVRRGLTLIRIKTPS